MIATNGNVNNKRRRDPHWSCLQCTFVNTAEKRHCQMCNSRGPALAFNFKRCSNKSAGIPRLNRHDFLSLGNAKDFPVNTTTCRDKFQANSNLSNAVTNGDIGSSTTCSLLSDNEKARSNVTYDKRDVATFCSKSHQGLVASGPEEIPVGGQTCLMDRDDDDNWKSDTSLSLRMCFIPEQDFSVSKGEGDLRDGLRISISSFQDETSLPAVSNDCKNGETDEVNFASSRAKRPTAGRPWDCTRCSFQNNWLNVCCDMCLSQRPSRELDHKLKSGKLNQESNYDLEDAKPLKALARYAASTKKENYKELSLHKSIGGEGEVKRPYLTSATQRELKDDSKRKRGRPTVAQNGKTVIISHDAQELHQEDNHIIGDMETRTFKRGKHKSIKKLAFNKKIEGQEFLQRHQNDKVDRRPLTIQQNTILNTRESEKGQWAAGKLIRYAFQTEAQEWLWYTGVVQAVWRKNSWFRVMFEDGEQMWVRCDNESKGRMWQDIEPQSLASEKVRFEKNLNLASPGAFDKLKFHVDGGCSSTNEGIVLGTRKAPRRQQKDVKSRSNIIPRSLNSVPHRVKVRVTSIEGDDIISSAEPPDDWSHPPSVNSLEPTVVEELASLPIEKKNEKTVFSDLMSPTKLSDKKDHLLNSIKGAASNKRRCPPRMKEAKKVCVVFHGLSNGEVLAVSKDDDKKVLKFSKPRLQPTYNISSHNWIACDRCAKWRRVSHSTFCQYGNSQWFCEMNNDDPIHAGCHTEEEGQDVASASPSMTNVESSALAPAVTTVHIETDKISKEVGDIELPSQRPAWISSVDRAFLVCREFIQTSWETEDISGEEDALKRVRDLVLTAVSQIPLSRNKWAKRLIQIGSCCRTINGMYLQLRAIVYGAGRSAGPILEKKSSNHRSCSPSDAVRKHGSKLNTDYRRYGHVDGNSIAVAADQSKAPVIDLSVDDSSASGDVIADAKSSVHDSNESPPMRRDEIANSHPEAPRNDNTQSTIYVPFQIGAPPNIFLLGGYNSDASNSLHLLDKISRPLGAGQILMPQSKISRSKDALVNPSQLATSIGVALPLSVPNQQQKLQQQLQLQAVQQQQLQWQLQQQHEQQQRDLKSLQAQEMRQWPLEKQSHEQQQTCPDLSRITFLTSLNSHPQQVKSVNESTDQVVGDSFGAQTACPKFHVERAQVQTSDSTKTSSAGSTSDLARNVEPRFEKHEFPDFRGDRLPMSGQFYLPSPNVRPFQFGMSSFPPVSVSPFLFSSKDQMYLLIQQQQQAVMMRTPEQLQPNQNDIN